MVPNVDDFQCSLGKKKAAETLPKELMADIDAVHEAVSAAFLRFFLGNYELYIYDQTKSMISYDNYEIFFLLNKNSHMKHQLIMTIHDLYGLNIQ